METWAPYAPPAEYRFHPKRKSREPMGPPDTVALMRFKTAKGVAHFPSLERTQVYQGVDTGFYTTKLILTAADAQSLIELCKEVAVDEHGPKKANSATMPYKKNDDGNFVFAFKSKHKPMIYDSTGTIVTDPIKISEGSIIKVAGALKPKQGVVGLNAFLNAVMVVDLNTPDSEPPFGPEDAEEGGFVGTPTSW